MAVLNGELRKLLENTIVEARREAESGALRALESLAVERHQPHPSMSSDERSLRNRLRARGRQLGDRRDRVRGDQQNARLTHEVAYEQWHRMLFARFLAENGVLVEPESGVSITVEECEELARELGVDPHALAANFAQEALPRVFRIDDPVLDIILPTETRQALQRLLDSLPVVVFTAEDSLGWTYQFWQMESKDAVNASGAKVGADELPAVTQVFTERYMVHFLLHNTLGAWWAGKVLAKRPRLVQTARDETELRKACALPGCAWEYLRFVKDAEGWRPAAGRFEHWPQRAADLRVLDPSCGSGHFLVAALDLLTELRATEEADDLQASAVAVLRDNLYGLEIDERCAQLAAFALALRVWTLPRAAGHVELPDLNVACVGLAPQTAKADWKDLARGDTRAANSLEDLHDMFSAAPILGSLISPRHQPNSLLTETFENVEYMLRCAMAAEGPPNVDDHERRVTAAGLSRAASLLADHYHLVVTNPPYLGLGAMSDDLAAHVRGEFDVAKRELALCMTARISQLVRPCGTMALVLPGEWTYARAYRAFRSQFLAHHSVHTLVRLGPNAFSSGVRANPVLIVASAGATTAGAIATFDVMKESVEEKGQSLRSMDVAVVSQRVWREAPDNRMLGSARDLRLGSTMADYADARNGLSAGDSARFERLYWEVGELGSTWELLQSSPSKSGYFSGQSKVVRWERERGQIAQLAESVRHLNHAAQSWRRGKPLWGRHGVVVSQIGAKVSIYTGERYDGSCFAIVPSSPDHVLPLMAYAFSGRLKDDLEAINPTWNLKSPETLLQLPFRPPDWEQAAEDMFGARIPLVPTDNPSQWPFSGAVATSLAPLHVAVARLLGYRWPNQTDDRHFEHSDIDGIICLQSVRGEERADQRMLALMRDADCEERLPASTLDGFVSGPGLRGRGAPWWMLNKLFEEHCKLFSQRPFIWHVWDGRDDGFNALVNAHKLAGAGGEGRRTLEALTYSYLGDWIARQRADQAAGVEGADARLAAAQDLQGQLENILVGEPPHDVFVRWKPLHEQPIGWDPDINDGIRVNIRPFMNAQLRSGGKKGAGILRWKPNIKWGKDRGKEPESLRPREDFPWFWGCPGKGPVDERTDFPGGNGYDGARWNDLHYSNAVKQTARDRAARAPGS